MKWKALYTDGTKLEQYNADGSANKYGNIKRDKLAAFVLFNDHISYTVNLAPAQRLIYRRRVKMTVGGKAEVMYILGWQEKIGQKNTQSILYIDEHGNVLLSGKWGTGMYCEPLLFKYEK